MQRNGKGVVLSLAIGLAIAVVALGSDRASGQAEIHVLIPAGGDGVVVGGTRFEVGDELVGRAAIGGPGKRRERGDGVPRVHGRAEDP